MGSSGQPGNVGSPFLAHASVIMQPVHGREQVYRWWGQVGGQECRGSFRGGGQSSSCKALCSYLSSIL